MTEENSVSRTYKSLYSFLIVLDENQVHKLHKVVSGLLDISAFSADEIEQLEKRLSLSDKNTFVKMNKN